MQANHTAPSFDKMHEQGCVINRLIYVVRDGNQDSSAKRMGAFCVSFSTETNVNRNNKIQVISSSTKHKKSQLGGQWKVEKKLQNINEELLQEVKYPCNKYETKAAQTEAKVKKLRKPFIHPLEETSRRNYTSQYDHSREICRNAPCPAVYEGLLLPSSEPALIVALTPTLTQPSRENFPLEPRKSHQTLHHQFS